MYLLSQESCKETGGQALPKGDKAVLGPHGEVLHDAHEAAAPSPPWLLHPPAGPVLPADEAL